MLIPRSLLTCNTFQWQGIWWCQQSNRVGEKAPSSNEWSYLFFTWEECPWPCLVIHQQRFSNFNWAGIEYVQSISYSLSMLLRLGWDLSDYCIWVRGCRASWHDTPQLQGSFSSRLGRPVITVLLTDSHDKCFDLDFARPTAPDCVHDTREYLIKTLI